MRSDSELVPPRILFSLTTSSVLLPGDGVNAVMASFFLACAQISREYYMVSGRRCPSLPQ